MVKKKSNQQRTWVVLLSNRYSKEPYESSKWACDLVSIVSSERFAKDQMKISSFTTSPGVVASDIGDLPGWITKARIILHYLVSVAKQ
jgi:hypothetical protein